MRQAALIVALVAALAVAGHLVRSSTFGAAQQPPANAPVPTTVEDAKRAKLAAAKAAYEFTVVMAEQGASRASDTDDRYIWSRRWMEAERESAPDDAGRRAATAAHLARMKAMLRVAVRRQEGGEFSAAQVAATRYYAAEAEQWAAEAGGPQ